LEDERCTCCSPLGTSVLTSVVLVLALVGAFRDARDPLSNALKISACVSATTGVVACWLTFLVDPGTPKQAPLDTMTDPPPVDETDDRFRIRDRHLPDGEVWRQKWCRTCRLWRPHRCGHCHTCKRCVLRLDHHCMWMGTCVGERNARFFGCFLLFMGAAMLQLLVLAAHHIWKLGCFSDSGCFSASLEPLAIIAFILLCPPCAPISCGSPILLMSSFWYGAMMLGDLRASRCQDADMWWAEVQRLYRCQGARLYCCSPAAFKVRPAWSRVAVVPSGAEQMGSCPTPLGKVDEA